jgi:hypothetical protein
MSARSRLRPRTRKSHASSWLIVESAIPDTRAARSRTHDRWRSVAIVRPNPFHRCHVVLMPSHSSVDSVSRARRAFSRAAKRAPVIELALERSKTSAEPTSEKPTSPSNGIPMITESTVSDAMCSSAPGSSRSCRRSTSTIRAVPSARSV